ncbi:MAG: gamma-glutamyl-gamma-aminobutyrate hydrolase family protein [Alphaproteobacteria bacterium]|nr:gamma-glutamyl-gamma-aminobutyrate hydrolase family protein [Alphaproteobacteria bacterium]
MKALIVCHKRKSDIGSFKTVLENRGLELDIRLGYLDKIEEIDPLEHDIAIFMGGPMLVDQIDIYPYIGHEISYIEKRLAADKPLLGVCLGAQLMANALGANVYRGPDGPEIGWHNIQVTPDGQSSPVSHLDEKHTMMYHWHIDVFDLPKGATLLASSNQYENQAFSYGKNALGVQFHPELNAANFEFIMALAGGFLPDPSQQVPMLRAQTEVHGDTLETQTAKFLNSWLDEVMEPCADNSKVHQNA